MKNLLQTQFLKPTMFNAIQSAIFALGIFASSPFARAEGPMKNVCIYFHSTKAAVEQAANAIQLIACDGEEISPVNVRTPSSQTDKAAQVRTAFDQVVSQAGLTECLEESSGPSSWRLCKRK